MLRVARIALLVHAAIAVLAAVLFFLGRVPHASEAPSLARLVATEHVAAAFMMVVVSRRLPREPMLIVLPLAFVFSNFAVHVYELAVLRAGDIPPLVVETIFLAIYAVFLASIRRA